MSVTPLSMMRHFIFFFICFAQSHHIYNISRYFETTNLFNHTSYIVSLESRSVILSGYHFCVIKCSRFDVRKLCAQLHSIWKCINPRSYGLCLYNKESARTRSHQRKFSKAKGKKLNHNAHTHLQQISYISFAHNFFFLASFNSNRFFYFCLILHSSQYL